MKRALALSVLVVFTCPLLGQTLSDSPRRARQRESTLGNLSERSTGVVLTAIAEAQQRGSKSLGVNDLIIALVLEDQEPNATLLFDPTPPGALFPPGVLPGYKHKPFFQPRTAIDVLVKLNATLPRSKSLPETTEVWTSPALSRVFAAAHNMPKQLNQMEVEVHASMVQAVVPLDLLAAALREPCEGTSMLKEAGITEEKVLQVINAGGDLETGADLEPPVPTEVK